MKIVCVSAARIPSDTANSIQVMKVCQAFTQLGQDVTLLVPGPRPAGLEPAALCAHYGLQTLFDIEWLPVHSRRLFPWRAVRGARRLHADLVYAWPIQTAALARLIGLPAALELHDFPSGSFGPLWLRLFMALPGRKRLLPITAALSKALRLPPTDTLISPDGVDLERYAALPAPSAARQ